MHRPEVIWTCIVVALGLAAALALRACGVGDAGR